MEINLFLSTKGMRRGGRGLICVLVISREIFSHVINGALKEDKVKALRLVAHSNSNFVLNLNGEPIILILIWCIKVGHEEGFA